MKIYERQFSEKAPKIVKHVLTGIYEYAKIFGIMTAENPMGIKISSVENKKRNKEFKEFLKRGRYQAIQVKGKYGNMENPFLILNIPLKTLKDFGDKYEQESIIYGEIIDYKEVTFEYWERSSKNSPLVLLDIADHIDVLNDPEDFYTRIKNWKFNIPFSIFEEALMTWYSKIKDLPNSDKKQLKEYIDIIVENNIKNTGHYFFNKRGKFNYIINKNKKQLKNSKTNMREN